MEGINSRMDGLQAAILNAKLPYLPAWTEARRVIAGRYDEILADVGDVITSKVGPDRNHVYHLYVIRTENRDALKEYLTQAGISTVLNYPKALPFYPAYIYLGHIPEDFPAAYFSQSRILSLPIYPEMTADMVSSSSRMYRQFLPRIAGTGTLSDESNPIRRASLTHCLSLTPDEHASSCCHALDGWFHRLPFSARHSRKTER